MSIETLALNSNISETLELGSNISTDLELMSGMPPGGFGYAIFNGSTSKITISDDNLFSFGDGANDSPFSITALVNPTDTTVFPIFSKDSLDFDSGGREWKILFETNRLQFYLYDDVNDGSIRRFSDGTYTSRQGEWINVAVTYNGIDANGMKVYVDGALVASSSATQGVYTAMSNTAKSVEIGKHGNGSSNFAEGGIRHVKIFDVELSASQVLTEHQDKSLVADLVAHYNLKVNAQDSGSNNFHGAITDVTFSTLPTLALESSLL